MKQIKNKKRLMGICLICSLLITGCEKKKDVYPAEDARNSGMPRETAAEAAPDTGLKKVLGLEEMNWKETVGSGSASKQIDTPITLPETETMCTLEVSERYYSAKDKKALCEHFLETDSIQVDVDSVLTKELAGREIKNCRSRIKDSRESGEDQAYIKMFQNEKKKLEALLPELSSKKKVSRKVGDYTEDQYVGTKNGVEYMLSFDMDQKSNTSRWSLDTLDTGYFTSEGLNWGFFDQWQPDVPDTDPRQENLCELTVQEACARAEKICEEAGITDMKAVSISGLGFFGQTDYQEFNGYYIALVREIQGVPVNGDAHYAGTGYLETEREHKTYDPERVFIKLNDKGLIGMSYEGGLSAGSLSNSAKLLGFEQIQELLRQEVRNTGKAQDRWVGLELTYLRVISEADPDRYSYIPAWRLSTEEHNGGCSQDTLEGTIWLNAIDGSRIDLERAGARNYITTDKYFNAAYCKMPEL